jgi:hypothetical protein
VISFSAGPLIGDDAQDEGEGWVTIFDGTSLDGWQINESEESWSLEDGMLKAQGERSHIFYVGDDEPFVNFELKVDCMTADNSNGGIYFHTQFQETGWPKYGHEAQVNNSYVNDPKKSGSLYGIVDVTEQHIPDDTWWTEHIIVRGRHIVIKLNDEVVVDYMEPEGQEAFSEEFERRLGSGTFALQAHDPHSIVRYKNIRVRRLPDDACVGFEIHENEDDGVTAVTFNGSPVLSYVHGVDTSTPELAFATSKVFHHVYGPGTDFVITNGPDGMLYPHHRGIYVGWNKTTFDGVTQDFWHCHNGETQRHVGYVDQSADMNHAVMTANISWNDIAGAPVIDELRTVSVSRLAWPREPGVVWQIDWTTTLSSERGEITLDGDRQHAGFQFRAHQAVAEANSATYVRPHDFIEQPAAFEVDDASDPNGHVNLGWLAMSYPLNEQQFNVEYFEDPNCPKPSRYSERPYGRFGAFYQATITPDQPLTMHYRLIVSRGPTPERDAIQARYEQFVADLSSARVAGE